MDVRKIDGVVPKRRIQKPRGVSVTVRVVTEQGSAQIPPRLSHLRSSNHLPKVRPRMFKGFPAFSVVAMVVISFAAGLFAMWQTRSSLAENTPQVVEGGQTPPGTIAIRVENETVPSAVPASNTAIYTMSLEQLEYYLQEGYKTPEMRQAELLRLRAEKIRTYLASKKSPLADIADTLAGLQHWRSVIAISNSESSLGKRCADNNCSGIGVEPGHPLWREYETKADWARDLDALIEKRYKNWTLEQMNGVYNNPGSENWVFAARQILDDLKDVE